MTRGFHQKRKINTMKKILSLVAMTFAIMTTIHAQSAQVKIKVKEAEIPVSVVESFKKDFRGGQAEEWDIVPAAIVGEEYVVSGFDNLDGEKPTSYAVIIKGTNTRAEAVYDKNGKLKYSKEVIKDTALPVAIRNAVTKKYPGFALISDQETIKEGRSNFIHYRIIIEKGKEKKALAVNESGKILREKKVRL